MEIKRNATARHNSVISGTRGKDRCQQGCASKSYIVQNRLWRIEEARLMAKLMRPREFLDHSQWPWPKISNGDLVDHYLSANRANALEWWCYLLVPARFHRIARLKDFSR